MAVVADAAAACRDEPEHGGDRDVLEEQDREHEVGLVVGQAAEVDQGLHRDGARRDVDAGRERERRERRAEGGEADDEAEAAFDEEVERLLRDRRGARCGRAARR